MSENLNIISKNLEDTDKVAFSIASAVEKEGGLICLYGEIGTGKTTLVKSLAKYLEIEEKVTSPSFVILNEYYSGKISMYHFDLYRLEKEGIKSVVDELREYTEGNNSLALVEWAQFDGDELPKDRLELTIEYIDETVRSLKFRALGAKSSNILKNIEKNKTIGELIV